MSERGVNGLITENTMTVAELREKLADCAPGATVVCDHLEVLDVETQEVDDGQLIVVLT